MTKRKVYSASNNNHNGNRRRGGHKRNSNSHENPNLQSGQSQSKPRNNENYRSGRSFQAQSVLPPPAILQEYEYATDGAASRILEMAEIEQDRRNEWETEYMRFYKKSLRLGQLFGFLILMSVVLATILLSAQGKDDVAMVLAGSAFLAVTAASFFSAGSARKNSRRTRRGRDRSRDKRERVQVEEEGGE